MKLSSLRHEYFLITGRSAGLSWDTHEMLERLRPHWRLNMTVEERLRQAAPYLARQWPRPSSNGLYIDELMIQAADELKGLHLLLGGAFPIEQSDEKG